MNPFANRWAAVFVVAFVMVAVAALVGTDESGGLLQRYANSLGVNRDAPGGAPPMAYSEGPGLVPEEVRHVPVEVIEEDPPAPEDFESGDEDPGLVDSTEGYDASPGEGSEPEDGYSEE